MVILCGIDGSASSREAARASAVLARKTGEPLKLVHVQEAFVFTVPFASGPTPYAMANTALLDAERERMTRELAAESESLARAFGIQVTHAVRTGLPDDQLIEAAREEDASLLVVASVGRRGPAGWIFGSVADRLSQGSPVPLLVVHQSRAFERWLGEERPLATVLALGAGRPTRSAASSVRELGRLGPLALREVHVYDPAREARRMGLAGAEEPAARARIEEALGRELPARDLPCSEVAFVPLPAGGSVPETLADFVEEAQADLLVLGTRDTGGLRRRLFGAHALGTLMASGASLLVVPVRADAAPERQARSVRRILVATDLSPAGDQAIDMALALVPAGGQLVLLHVDIPPDLPSGFIMGYHPEAQPTPGERKMRRALAEAELEKRVSRRQDALELVTEVVESEDVVEAILAAAERHAVDLVCLGTHHHGRVAAVLIGSVARTVARRSTRPVLLVPSVPGA